MHMSPLWGGHLLRRPGPKGPGPGIFFRASEVSDLAGWEQLGGLAAMGMGWHAANDCQAARSRMHDSGAHSSELPGAWRWGTPLVLVWQVPACGVGVVAETEPGRLGPSGHAAPRRSGSCLGPVG